MIMSLDGKPASAPTQSNKKAAKALVSTVVRAFYDENAVAVVDYLLDSKFLRDGQDIPSLPKVQETLAFLKREHLVDVECVEGRVETKDKNRTYRRTERDNFWFLNLNQAVSVIGQRLQMIQNKLEQDIRKAEQTSTYQCPGYLKKVCNGLYTKEEVQKCPKGSEGVFLCLHCPSNNVLQQVDNTKAKQDAEEKLKRFQSQMNEQKEGRPGIYDLLEKVTKGPPVFNSLPSENGAQEVLIGQVLYDTTNFQTEAAEEFSNSIFVTGTDGQRVVLDLELGTGIQANVRPDSSVEPSGTLPKPTNHRTKSLEALQPLPKPKRICRNTTPLMMQQKQQGGSDGVAELTQQTRQLSIDLDILQELDNSEMDASRNDPATSFDIMTSIQIPDQDTCVMWQSMNDSTTPDRAKMQQLVQRVVKNRKTPRRASSFPPHGMASPSCTFQSMDTTSLFNSVDWQSNDTAKSKATLEPLRDEEPFNNNNNDGRKSVFNSVDILDNLMQSRDGPANMSLGFQSLDMIDALMGKPSALQSQDRAASIASVDLGTSLSTMLQSMNGDTFNNLLQSTQTAAAAHRQSVSMLESLVPHLQSMDNFAMGMGNQMNSVDVWKSMEGPLALNRSKSSGRKGLGDLLGSANTNAQPNTFDKNKLDSLQIFKSTEYWENAFATKDIQELNLPWQQMKQPNNNMPTPLPTASMEFSQQNTTGARPDHFTSKDWMSADMFPEGAIDISVFQTQDKKPAASKQPKKTNSADRYMKMYREGLNQASRTSTGSSNAAAVPNLNALGDWLPKAAPPSNVPVSSLFPPLPDNMPTLSSPMPHAHHVATNSNKAKEKMPIKAKDPKTKKKGKKTEPEVKVFVEFTDLDVLCQRGTKSRLHPGSQRYRALGESKKPEYRMLTDKYLKTKFAEDLVKEVHCYGGRFLENDKDTGQWYIIPDASSRRKAGQALRDINTPEARKKKREKYSK